MFHLFGKKFQMIVQGCRTNLYEGDAAAAALEAAGAVRCEKSPDIAVIMTCTITAVADRKCRKLIRRLRRENPNALIAACGCYVQKLTDEELAALGIDVAVGSRQKHLLPELLEERYEKKSMIIISQLPLDKWYDYIAEATLADAIMDRLINSSHHVNLEGPSLRKRKK